MKPMKLMISAVVAFASVTVACAGENDKPIAFAELPVASQKFIRQYFDQADVSYITMDTEWLDKSYDVVLNNGCKVEFDKNGIWEQVDGGRSPIPTGVVPTQIQAYVKAKHPAADIVQIDQNKKSYEIELNNGLEIRFDRTFQVIGYDD